MSQPPFAEPSTYVRYIGPILGETTIRSSRIGAKNELRFMRLNARESPLKLVHTFPSTGPGSRTSQQTFTDLEVERDHLYQVFMGVSQGSRARVFHTLDERILKLDQQTLDQANEEDTANIEYEDSPLEDPRFEFWISPGENNVPAFDAENILSGVVPGRSITPKLRFLAAKYTYEFILPSEQPDLHAKLETHKIPSRFITFGGRI